MTYEERLIEDRTSSNGQQTEIHESPLKHKKKHFYSEGGQTLNKSLREAADSPFLEILQT